MTKEETKAYYKAYSKRRYRIEKGLRAILELYTADDLENTDQYDNDGREYKEYVWCDRTCVRVEFFGEMLEMMTAFIHTVDAEAKGQDPFTLDDDIYNRSRRMALNWISDKALIWTGDYEPDKSAVGCSYPTEKDPSEYYMVDDSKVFKRGVVRQLNYYKLREQEQNRKDK